MQSDSIHEDFAKISAKILKICTPLVIDTNLKGLSVDHTFARSTPLLIRLPSLTIQVVDKLFTGNKAHLPETMQWENRNRSPWHVAFAAQGDDCKV